MTVPSGVSVAGPFNGNGSTTSFPYNFELPQNEELTVIHADENGVETELTLNVDYTVNGVGDPLGGSVSYPVSGSPLAAGKTITLVRSIGLTQGVDLGTQGKYSPEKVEGMADRLTMICQQLRDELTRCVKVSVSSGDNPDQFLQSVAQAVTDALTHATTANNHKDTALQAVSAAQQEVVNAQNQVTLAINEKNQAAQQVVAAGNLANLAQVWAEGVEPGGVGTKSAKEHAESINPSNMVATSDYTGSVILSKLVALNQILVGINVEKLGGSSLSDLSAAFAASSHNHDASEINNLPSGMTLGSEQLTGYHARGAIEDSLKQVPANAVMTRAIGNDFSGYSIAYKMIL